MIHVFFATASNQKFLLFRGNILPEVWWLQECESQLKLVCRQWTSGPWGKNEAVNDL